MTKQRFIQNRWSAWVLVLLFMLPVILKAFHQHEEPHCCHAVEDTQHEPTEDSGDDCLICHFFYSSFTEMEMAESVVYLSFLQIESISYLFAETIHDPHAYYLRGPPAIA